MQSLVYVLWEVGTEPFGPSSSESGKIFGQEHERDFARSQAVPLFIPKLNHICLHARSERTSFYDTAESRQDQEPAAAEGKRPEKDLRYHIED